MANVFTADSNCKELWKFENGALTTGTIGSNTLTDVNTVATNTTTKKEGDASADFTYANAEYFHRADADLSAGFPLKNGDTNKIISVCVWANLDVLTSSDGHAIFAKYDAGATNKRSFALSIDNNATNARVTMRLGYAGGTLFESKQHASNLSVDTWYHITATYNDADKSYAIRVKDTSGNTVGTDLTGTATLDANKLNVEDALVCVGAIYSGGSPASTFYMEGLIDELAVFDDVITAAEATAIAQGTYIKGGAFVIADSGSASSAENIVLVQGGGIFTIADSSSASSAENIALIFNGTFTIADCASTSSAENIVLVQASGAFVIADAISASSAENVSLIFNGTFQIADAISSSSADEITLILNSGVFAIADCVSASSAENITLEEATANEFVIQDAVSASSAENIVLVQASGTFVIADAVSTSSADEITLSAPTGFTESQLAYIDQRIIMWINALTMFIISIYALPPPF